uniref:Uncharacterized protein n=1 Tax=Octactis speculum TaxID=3111310 RepID=A0A7S2F493_9STRA
MGGRRLVDDVIVGAFRFSHWLALLHGAARRWRNERSRGRRSVSCVGMGTLGVVEIVVTRGLNANFGLHKCETGARKKVTPIPEVVKCPSESWSRPRPCRPEVTVSSIQVAYINVDQEYPRPS